MYEHVCRGTHVASEGHLITVCSPLHLYMGSGGSNSGRWVCRSVAFPSEPYHPNPGVFPWNQMTPSRCLCPTPFWFSQDPGSVYLGYLSPQLQGRKLPYSLVSVWPRRIRENSGTVKHAQLKAFKVRNSVPWRDLSHLRETRFRENVQSLSTILSTCCGVACSGQTGCLGFIPALCPCGLCGHWHLPSSPACSDL